jgi:hypothetical protein
MDIIENVRKATELLNEVEEYGATLFDKLSVLDSKEQDLLHYIENNKINVLWCFKMVREIKNVRLERRKVKNDMELIYKFNESKNKLASKENRPFILTELNKRAKLFDAPYKNRQYTEEELHGILGGK